MGGVRLSGAALVASPFVPFFDGGDSGDLYKVPFTGPPTSLVLAGSIYQPAASPDYTQIAFLEFNVGSDLKVCDADGSNVVTLKTGGDDFRWPDWHPSGSHILYGNYAGDGGELRRIDPDGTNDTLVYDATVGGMNLNSIHRAVYNHDGTKIAFILGRQTTPPSSAPDDQLIVIDADGSNPVVVATLNSLAEFGENAVGWMHNSDVVAYHVSALGVAHHWRVDADGTNAIELATGDTSMTHRRPWSLDDETFYFLNFDSPAGHYTLWSAAADGSDLGAEIQVSPPFMVFRPPPLVFPNGRIYADLETDDPSPDPIGLGSILEDGSDFRIEYGVSSVRLESHF